MIPQWAITLALGVLCVISVDHHATSAAEETTEQEATTAAAAEDEEIVTEPEKRYAYLKGNREPDDKKYDCPDEMYRDILKHILRLFWSLKCHISEIKFQYNKLNSTLDSRITADFNVANNLMAECGDDILNILRDNITSSERVDPIDRRKLDVISTKFKDVRSYFDRETLHRDTKEMEIIKERIKTAEEQLHEGHEIVIGMIKNVTRWQWPQQ